MVRGISRAAVGTAAIGTVGSAAFACLAVVLVAADGLAATAGAVTAPLAAGGAGVPTASSVGFVTLDYAPSPQTLHLGVYSALTVVLLSLGYWILSTRQTRGAKLFAASILLASMRTGLDVVHVVVGDLWILHSVTVLAALVLELLIVLTFLRFAGRYADEPVLSNASSRRAYVGVAAAGTLLVGTNFLHGLVIGSFEHHSTPFVYVAAELGTLGWLLAGLMFALLLLGAGLLARSFTVAEQPDWWSAAMLTMGICLASVVVVLNVLGQVPLPTFDYSGAAIAFFLLLTAPALLGHGLRRIEISARESMLRELDDPIVIVDDKRYVVDYTAAAESLLPDGATGRPFEDVLDIVPEWPAFGETATAEVDRSDIVLDDASKRAGRTDAGAPTRPDDGDDEAGDEAGDAADDEPAHYLMQTSPVTSETGDVIGYTIRFADVTDLKRRTAELARKNEQLDQFANTISHDLREPLNVASEYVALLEDAIEAAGDGDVLDARTVHDYLDTIDRSLERMRHIIDDLLALARDTDPVSDRQTVAFAEAVRDAWSLVDTEFGQLHVDGGGTIEADPECLQRIFENLFRLVFDAAETPPSPSDDRDAASVLGGSVQIVAGLTEDGFYCAADGPALPSDVSAIEFEQSANAGPDQRSLELSIVEHIASAHGWTVDVDTEQSGVRFEVTDCITTPEESLAGGTA